jgi:hypothetical protein
MQPLTHEELDDAINDTFMVEECSKFTGKMLENKIKMDTICALIKEYQTKYLYIKSQNENFAQKFTVEMWWRCRK